jgi:hypothetical protein
VPLILCLNELSCKHSLPPEKIDEAMDRFSGALRESRRVRPGAVLITPVQLPNIELAPGYPMARWAADSRNKDMWLRIRSMQDKAPYTFDEVRPPAENWDSEYLYSGCQAFGLGAAHSCGGLAISLPTDPQWIRPEVDVTKVWVDGDDEKISVRHASSADHVGMHEIWLARAGLADIDTGRDLWEARQDHFPSLTFLPRVRDDLLGLPPVCVHPVRVRLMELQDAVSCWDPATGQQPVWISRVTGEHEQRRRQWCQFVDLDGETRAFDLHARFTPYEGRVHFRLIGADGGSARIAYVGRKLGI